jgi:hypothetical protein
MSKLHVYVVRYSDGYEEVLLAPDDKMSTPDAAEAFEIELRETTTWFYPLGEIESRPDGRDDSIDIAPLAALVTAWKVRGSPKIPGAGAGPSPFAIPKNKGRRLNRRAGKDYSPAEELVEARRAIRARNKYKEEIQMARCVFYVVCKQSGEEEASFYDEPSVERYGGLKALETSIHDDSRWYNPLGEMEVRTGKINEDPEILDGIFRGLLEPWIEKGAPTIKGAAGTDGLGGTSSKFVRRYFFYKYCDKDGRESLSCHSEAQVQECGSIAALESVMGEHSSWFYPVGSLLCGEWVERSESGIEIPFRRIKALVDAWLEQGSPWKPGKFAQDLDAPPEGHPFEG